MGGVLDGVRVLDFSRIFAGPAATQILGDLGADVVKVENPGGGDEARNFGVSAAAKAKLGASPSFLALNRSKRSIVLDLGQEQARQAAFAMAVQSDVLVHNFRPGTMEKFGLGYPALRQANPRIVYCQFFAFGDRGPLAHLGANDLSLQAHVGLMSVTGEEGGRPVRCGTAAVDLHASLGLVSAVLAALLHREKTGLGQQVETSLLRSGAHLMSYFYTDYWMTGREHQRMGTANHLTVPNQAFPASDGDVIIIAPSDDMWRRLVCALDAETLGRPEYATAAARRDRRREVVAAIAEVTRKLTCSELASRLGAAKVNVAKVNSIGEAATDPQLAAIGGVVEQPFGERMLRSVAVPFAMRDTPPHPSRPPPKPGEHADEILGEFGFGGDAIAALRQSGALGEGTGP